MHRGVIAVELYSIFTGYFCNEAFVTQNIWGVVKCVTNRQCIGGVVYFR